MKLLLVYSKKYLTSEKHFEKTITPRIFFILKGNKRKQYYFNRNFCELFLVATLKHLFVCNFRKMSSYLYLTELNGDRNWTDQENGEFEWPKFLATVRTMKIREWNWHLLVNLWIHKIHKILLCLEHGYIQCLCANTTAFAFESYL